MVIAVVYFVQSIYLRNVALPALYMQSAFQLSVMAILSPIIQYSGLLLSYTAIPSPFLQAAFQFSDIAIPSQYLALLLSCTMISSPVLQAAFQFSDITFSTVNFVLHKAFSITRLFHEYFWHKNKNNSFKSN